LTLKALRLRALAKINLYLEVLGQRADGYHELNSLMARVTLADELTLEPQEAGANQDTLTVAAEGLEPFMAGPIGSGYLDPGFRHQNLALKALDAVREYNPEIGFFKVHLLKRIPLAAGLGGGSADAAAILSHFGRLLGLSLDKLMALALKLGSDLPFFLGPPLAVAQGRGEKLTPVALNIPTQAVLVNPGFPLATKEVFRALALTKEPDNNNLGPDWRSLSGIGPLGRNDLLAPALKIKPELNEILRLVKGLGAEYWGLSGSGPTFWALFSTEKRADKAQKSLLASPFWSVRASLARE
jgi:4-diphosphocytidyl-2-C-methyl-D-erythritol kinase